MTPLELAYKRIESFNDILCTLCQGADEALTNHIEAWLLNLKLTRFPGWTLEAQSGMGCCDLTFTDPEGNRIWYAHRAGYIETFPRELAEYFEAICDHHVELTDPTNKHAWVMLTRDIKV